MKPKRKEIVALSAMRDELSEIISGDMTEEELAEEKEFTEMILKKAIKDVRKNEPVKTDLDLELELMTILKEEIQKEIQREIDEGQFKLARQQEPESRHDILGINKYKESFEDGRQVYGVRGIGPTYNSFYRYWFQNIEPVWESHDWPWHYFTLEKEDEEELFKTWGKFFME